LELNEGTDGRGAEYIDTRTVLDGDVTEGFIILLVLWVIADRNSEPGCGDLRYSDRG
jgi:hypothetical protein